MVLNGLRSSERSSRYIIAGTNPYARVSEWAAYVAIGTAVTVLIGWLFGIGILTSLATGWATMKPNTAISFLALGIGLLFKTKSLFRSQNVIAIGSASIACYIGLATLAEYAFHFDLPVEDLILRKTLLATGIPHPGRPALATALGITLLGTGLLTLDVKTTRRFAIPELSALGASFLGFVALLGYALGVQALYLVFSFTSIAVHTAALLVLLGVGILFSRSQQGMMSVVCNKGLGGLFARRLLPLAIAFPLINAWLRLYGQRAGWYGPEVGLALHIGTQVTGLTAMLWAAAWWLNRTDLARRQIDGQLLLNEERLRVALKNSPVAVFNQDRDLRYTWMNHPVPAWAEEDYLGKTDAELLGPENAQELSAIKQRVLATGVRTRQDVALTTNTGVRWFDLTIEPLRDRNGVIVGITSASVDITEKKRIAKLVEQQARSIQHSEEQLRMFFEHAAAALAILDNQMRYLRVSRRWLNDYGLKDRDLVGLSHYEVFPDLPERWKEVHRRALAGETVTAENDPFERADGSVQWLRWEVRPWFAPGGRIGGISIFTEDVTTSQKAEEALRESELQFRTLANAIPQLCWMAKSDGRIFWYNQRWYQYTGTTPAEMETGGWRSVDPDELPKVLHRWRASIQTGEPFDMVFPLRGADGIFRPFLTRVMPVRNVDHQVVLWFGTNTDISQQKKAEESLHAHAGQLRALAVRMQQIREEERSAVARDLHDQIGQILTAVNIDVAWLSKHLPENQALQERLSKTTLVLKDALHSVRRICSGLRPGVLDDLGLAAAIEWQAGEFTSRTGIPCQVSVTPEYLEVPREQATALFRIFQEALTNVARHAGARHVCASLSLQNGTISMILQDDGRGIREAEVAGSLGILGMKERAQVCGGEVNVLGVPGQGTTVSVRMPAELYGGERLTCAS